MDSSTDMEDTTSDDPIERTNFCMPDISRDVVAHAGEDGFRDLLRHHFQTPENNALERLIRLKQTLKDAGTHDFWTILMREMTSIGGAQCGFAAKRILVDDENSAIEMPPLGEPGSCLMGTAFYLNNGKDVDQMYHDYRYLAHGSPCAHMRHDKVFIIPDRMSEFVRNSPNKLPWEKSEAFLGLPLWADEKCFAHFGMIWSSEGASKRKLSWSFLEMFMHALEDIVTERLVRGRGFAKAHNEELARVIPAEAVTASQSLKPYARSLSHELRTPMQGVVGMIEIMQATISEAMESQTNDDSKFVFQELKAHLELVQDSSKRAVEAADNVVHAYDLNMEMPDTPMSLDNDAPFPIDEAADFRDIYERTFDQQQDSYMSDDSSSRKRKAKDMAEPVTCELENDRISRRDFAPSFTPTNPKSPAEPQPNTASLEVSPGLTPLPPPFSTNLEADHRHIAPIDLLRGVVRRALEAVRPREMIPMSCQDGEVVLIKMEGPRGRIYEVKVSYTVARHVPARIITKELNLKWILTKAVDNALKFTLEGEIALHMRLSRSGQLVETTVIDTGCGISEESKEHVFKPHFQEDSTISRLREGLGLSLFNAKAHARKHLKGDMTLERSDTDGPNRGSEFLIRFPLITRPRGNNKFATFLTDTIAPECPPLPRLSSCSSTSHSINGVINGTAGEIPFTPLLPLKLRLEVKKPPFDRELGSKIPLQILVVDDNLVNRNILEGYLKRLGYPSTSISLAFDGVEAVQRYEASLAPDAKPVDAILMDLWMPNMDGYQATERIMEVAKGSGRCPKVFAVTADITVESEERTKKAGMHGFVSKPYRVTDVQRLIVEHFGGGRG